ncbi:hypothetical protein F8388_004180 [Cannabis sativa]|uniref:Major facilitator superfamily (MFS) profile domain-containing protein n=1 Tax=Cannabis sativa TaxID=3483 RepID=A0A7J6E6X5_CANSA|nr:hypothetical protein F8388_004180 [Cannabis sativa]
MAGEQMGVLNALDMAKTQLYHFTAIVIAGMGFFTDAYDLFCISLVTKLLGRIYYTDLSSDKPGNLPPNVAAAVNGVAFVGTLTGQLFFGWLGDKMGRKKVYGLTLLVMVICSVASGLSFGQDAKAVMATLCFFRFWLGFGIGGDYPLSATIMSEYANKKTRGAFIAAVFAMQGFGILGGGIIALIVSGAFKAKYDVPAYIEDRTGSLVPQADYVWRIILMFGAFPAAITYYWRMKMPETARYTALVAKNAAQAAADMSKVLQVELEADVEKVEKLSQKGNSYGLFSKEFARRHGLHLIGTTSTWFLLDIAFYSSNLFQKDIFTAIGWIPAANTMNAIEEVFRIARAQTLIALCSTVPGYWFTVAFIDSMGRFAIQLMGFFFMTVFMFALAFPYHHWKKNHIGFVIMYSLTFFFSNFGPNATTFVVPAEIFPARLRSTCHGISAAAGKAGAIVGAFGFLYAAQDKDPSKTEAGYPPGIGVKNALIMLGVINFLGMVFTFLVPESKGKSLEELTGENEDGEMEPTPASTVRTDLAIDNNTDVIKTLIDFYEKLLGSKLTQRKKVFYYLAMAGEQMGVLNALDVAKTQLYHFTAIVIAGMGFFTDAYDLFCISLVTKLLGRIYYTDLNSAKPGNLPPNVAAAVNGVAFVGTLTGQLFFGWLGDKMGRKKVYGLTLLVMVICSVASGLSFGQDAKAVMATLCFFRFWLGFGIGGDYPLSATIMSEYANKKTRGAFIAAVFAMQGFGILGGGIVALIVSTAFNAKYDAPSYLVDRAGSLVHQADYVWRIILMFGAFPAAVTYYWRMKMPETARYTALVAKNAKQAASDMSKVLQVELEADVEKVERLAEGKNSFGLFSKQFARRHGLHLVGTTTTWFLLDIAFYSQNLFQKDIFSAIGWIPAANTMNAIEEVYKIARAQTLIALCSTVPGYWFTVAFIDKMGRFAIQLMGFFFMTVFMFALAIPYNHWTQKDNHIGFVIMYSLTFFFANFGPNATTFVVPAEIFPARLRSTCHGISAAAGKAGAMVGAFGFLYSAQSKDPSKTEAGYPPGIGIRDQHQFSTQAQNRVPNSDLHPNSRTRHRPKSETWDPDPVPNLDPDPDREQMGVLNALDVAKTQLYHFTAIVIAGMGFFTDAYDLFCISLVTKLLGRIYYTDLASDKPGNLPPNVAAAVNGVAFVGTLTGQLFFGWLGDKMGRKKVYGLTLLVMVVCSVASGLSFSYDAKAVMATLCFFRFWLGFGIGGDYPLSATIMSEYANKKTRGAFIAAVFAMQGFGILGGGIVALIVSTAFNAKYDAPSYLVDRAGSLVHQADYVWRIILMFGAFPAAVTYYWRMKMPETARYTALVAKDAKQAASDMSKVLQVELEADVEKVERLSQSKNSFGLFSKQFAKRHGLHLVGTTTTWFLLDIAFYSQNLFQKDIFSAIGWIPKANTMNAIEEVYKIARAQTLIALCSTVPGYWFTVAFIDHMGRFAIQLMGFFFMTVFMFALAIPYNHWTQKDNHIGFVIMYSLTFFFANFGPNATTFVVPAEIFPARLRSTCHGISAAAGKAGAMVGAFGFLYSAQSKDPTKTEAGYPPGIGVKNSLIMLGVINFLGMAFTFLVPESKGISLEELTGENDGDAEPTPPIAN